MKKGQAVWLVLFSVKSTLRVGEIPLRGVKSGLRPGEIAAAVGGFYFTENRRFSISPKAKPLISFFAMQRISLIFSEPSTRLVGGYCFLIPRKKWFSGRFRRFRRAGERRRRVFLP